MKNKEDKWPHLSRLMFDERIGIMAVGETHLTEAQIEEIEEAAMGRKRLRIFNSIDPDHPNKGGVAVVLNRDITNTENIKVRRLIPGRAILVTIPWHNKLTLTVLAVYAPAGSPAENKAFWEELHRLWMTENLPVPDVMLGDMNIVEDAIDRLPHRTDDAGAAHALADFKRILELKDGWRMTYPDTKQYTFSRGTGSHSRIDRIYVSPTLFKKCRHWDISDAAGDLTDHRLISVNICAPGAPYIGPGRYAIPLYLMNDVTFMEYAVKTGAQLFDEEESDESENIQVRFKKFKDMVGTFAKARASLTIGALEQKKLKLQKKRNNLLEDRPEADPATQQRR
ncbi:Endonuclease/exonuclease/phosphatase [Mycena alexandri]|uniref:Endonuclease/exonuclease/phosphatase n=1 Tax=Mycena alexandri TaxID=1745969 RepID=A0AAD6XG02_9AGAR|nr:Endonuclease/exonuclease/phosphatase [Mycena alexandri]